MEELKTYLQRNAVWTDSAPAGRAHPDIQIGRENVSRLRCRSPSMEVNGYDPQSDQKATCHCISEGQSRATHTGVKQTHGLCRKFPAASRACRMCCMTISASFKKEPRRKVAQHDEE